MRMTKAKTIVAAVGTVATALSAAFADNVFSGSEAGGIASTIVTAGIAVWAVWRVPNQPVEPFRG